MKTPVNFEIFKRDLNEAMKIVAEKHNLSSLKVGNISYGEFDFTAKIEAKLKLSDSDKNKAEENTKSLLRMYGLDENLLNSTIKLQNKIFKITGVNTRNRKNPIEILELSTGKMFKCPISSIK